MDWRTGVDSLPFCFPLAESASRKVPICKLTVRLSLEGEVLTGSEFVTYNTYSSIKNNNTEVFKNSTLCPYLNTVVIFSLTTHTSSTESSN